jgi:PAS domain S-box-containing protein
MPRHVDGEVYWRRDGTCFPVEYTVAPVLENGQVKGTVNLFRDVSERLRIDSERARTLAVTQALANLLRLSLDSKSLESMLDAALGELLSLPWLQLERQACIFLLDGNGTTLRMAASRNLPPDICGGCATVPVGSCLCGQAAATGQIVFADCHDPAHGSRHASAGEHGHYCVPIGTASECLGVLNAYVGHGHRRDADEERFLAMVADTLAGMIKRKQVEETLQLSEGRAKALLNAPTDAAFLMAPDGTVLACNDAFAARFGKSIDQIVGTDSFAMLPPDLATQRRQVVEQVLSQAMPVEISDEHNGMALDNRLFPMLDARGAVAQVAVFSRDVTEQQRAAREVSNALAELARSNEELQQFAYVASHDLRQPLRMVTSYLGLIERRLGAQLDGEIKEFMAYAVDGAKRMDRLIIDLLDYSRAGKSAAPFTATPLGVAAADALINLRIAAEESIAEIIVAPDLPCVLGDAGELTRLFQNLIGNAIKYRAPDRPPRVEIGWRPDSDYCLLWVRDNGIGIAPEDCERAFRVFQRLVPNDRYEGTGIGLAVCRKIAEHHGGKIWIESEPGTGSTFFVRLPGPLPQPA